VDIIQTPEVAEHIGALHRKARDASRESISHLLDCGHALIVQKAALPHGEWLLWCKAHEHIMGFGERTARYLMAAAANRKPAADFSDDFAAKLHRAVWGREPEVSAIPHDPFQNFERFRDWAAKHHTDFVELSVGQRASLMELYGLIGRVLTLPVAKAAA
jgi:hypothetical protein